MQDLYNNFNGVGVNGPTYGSPGYNGAGACLWLNQAASQSASINSTFVNMAYTSFTLEVWMYANTLHNNNPYTDNAVFGQFQQNILDHSLYIVIRNQRIYFGFFADDVSGTQESDDHASCFRALTIGTNNVNAPNNYFDGCLDSIAYFGRAKNATEVLDDATNVAYLSFDDNSLLDSGPLLINGTGTSYSYTSLGRVNAALTLSGSSSYIQITGLRRLGTSGWPYSVAIWIKPTSSSGGTIMHLSSGTAGTGSWCIPIMGFTSAGQIAINSWSGGNVVLTGPIVSLNSWTHVAATYSSSNGERLYVNGAQYGSSSSTYTFSASSVPMTITLGNSLSGIGYCATGTIQMGQYSGSLDEFRVYARELTASEVYSLAHP
ncbi:unnamed protein product [Rotaria sp. Silwood1]|nr:unnamed protein product [Rotaria sp. Silwood1]